MSIHTPNANIGEALYYKVPNAEAVFVRYPVVGATKDFWLVGPDHLRVHKVGAYHSSYWGFAEFLTDAELPSNAAIYDYPHASFDSPRLISEDQKKYDKAVVKARNEIKKLINSTGNLQLLEGFLSNAQSMLASSRGPSE